MSKSRFRFADLSVVNGIFITPQQDRARLSMNRARVFLHCAAYACDKTLSTDPEKWSLEDVFLGHSDLVALMAQEMFGGIIVRYETRGNFVNPYSTSRYTNILPGNIEINFCTPGFHDKALAKLERTEDVLYHLLRTQHVSTNRFKPFKERFNDQSQRLGHEQCTMLYFPEIDLEVGHTRQ